MTLFELNEVLRGIPAEKLGNIDVEYYDTSVSEQLGYETFCQTKELRLTIEEDDHGGHIHVLRVV